MPAAASPRKRPAVFLLAFVVLLGVAILAGVKMGFALRAQPAPPTSVARPGSSAPPAVSGNAAGGQGVIEIPMVDMQDQPAEGDR
jgi:hypothetical protein